MSEASKSVGRTVVDVVEDWFGQELSQKLVKRARRLSSAEVLEYCRHLDSALEKLSLPARTIGQSRPLAEDSYDLKGLLLLADDVAVPNVAMPRPLNDEPEDFDDPKDFSDPSQITDLTHHRDIQEGLERLLRLKPLVVDGAVSVLPLSREGYERRALARIRKDPALYDLACCFFPESERQEITRARRRDFKAVGRAWTEYDETGWIKFAASFGMAPFLNLLIAAFVALEIEVDPMIDAQVSSSEACVVASLSDIADGVAAYYATSGLERKPMMADLAVKFVEQQARPATSSLDTLTVLLQLEVPRLDKLSYEDLAKVRTNQTQIASFRAALRRGLAEARNAPDGADWSAYARAVVRDEMIAARAGVEEEIRRSAFLQQGTTGVRSLLVSAVGAGAGWIVGGSPMTALVSSAAATGASSLRDLITATRRRPGDRALFSHYIGFDDPEPPESGSPIDNFSRRSVSRIDLLFAEMGGAWF